MKRSVKFFLFIVLMLFAGLKGFSQQAIAPKVDSLHLKEKQEQATLDADLQNAKGNAFGQANKNRGSNGVKQVRGRRPDMSKARGARPPSIVRPSGSGIPKGVGRPGGAGRKGGR